MPKAGPATTRQPVLADFRTFEESTVDASLPKQSSLPGDPTLRSRAKLWSNLKDHAVIILATSRRSSIKIAVSVAEQGAIRICSVRSTGEIVERGVDPLATP